MAPAVSELTSPAPAASLARAADCRYRGIREENRDSKTAQRFLDLKEFKRIIYKNISFLSKIIFFDSYLYAFYFCGTLYFWWTYIYIFWENIFFLNIFFGNIFFFRNIFFGNYFFLLCESLVMSPCDKTGPGSGSKESCLSHWGGGGDT